MTQKNKDLLASLIFFAFGMFIYIMAIPIETILDKDLGSGFMPKVVAVAIMVTSLSKAVTVLLNKNSDYCNKKIAKKEDSDFMGGVLTIVALAAYVLLFDFLGFILSTGLYLFAQIVILSGKEKFKLVPTLAISICAPVIIYVLFVYAISMPLPNGILNF